MSNRRYVLSVICNQLKRYAESHPWKPGMSMTPYTKTLSGGLRIVLLIDQPRDEWYLELSHLQVDPSDIECLIMQEILGMPAGAKEQRTVIGFNEKENHKVRWRWPADRRTE